jgi:hypothetical protein
LPDGADEDNGNTIAGERADAFGATVEFWDPPFKLPEPLFRFFSETPWTRPSEFSLVATKMEPLAILAEGADEDNGNAIAGERANAFGATVEFWDCPFKLPEPLFRFFSETPWTRPSEFSLLLLQALNFLND